MAQRTSDDCPDLAVAPRCFRPPKIGIERRTQGDGNLLQATTKHVRFALPTVFLHVILGAG
jgi:hypothetical protein